MTLYKTKRKTVKAQFVLEVSYKAWSPGPESAPIMTARIALMILICHGLFSEAFEMGILDNLKGVAEEFLSSALWRMKVVEVFTKFSMMEVSSGGG